MASINKRTPTRPLPSVWHMGLEFTCQPGVPHCEHYYTEINGQRVYLHRLIWSAAHNRPVPRGCEIHHLDGNKLNNEISNLVCLTEAEHARQHRAAYPARWRRRWNALRSLMGIK